MAAVSTLSSFESSQFRWLFFSNTIFFLGMGGQQVLRAWLVFQLTGSELALGWISAVVGIPMLLIAPIGGAIADRVDRRNLIAIGQATVVVSELLILVLYLTDELRFWHILVLAFIMGTVFPFIMPARQAIVANVVGRARLTNAMALNMAAVSVTRVVGPAAAGFLIGATGIGIAYGINVALYTLALTFMAGVESAPPEDADHEAGSLTRNITEGFAYVRDHRLVMVLLFFGLVPMFLAMPFQNLLVVFTENIWNAGAQGLGILSAISGVGGVVGAVVVAARSESPRRLRAMMLSAVGFGGFLFLFAISPSYLVALPLAFLANVFVSLYSALNNTAIQLLVPDRVRGRVSSFLMMSFSLPLLGTLPVSAVAEVAGAPVAVAGASVLAVLIAFAFYAFSPALRRMDLSLAKAKRAAN